MIFMTFIFMHSVIICVVLSWRTYETHPALSFKSGCDTYIKLIHELLYESTKKVKQILF
jgi:hypothetical protein